MSRQRRSRGAGFVRERGEGCRQLVVKIEGHQYVRSVRTRTLREAEKMLPGFIVEIQNGEVTTAKVAVAKAKEAPIFSVAAAEFIEREWSKDKRNNTRQAYAKSLNRVAKALGNEKVSKIDKNAIRDVMLTINSEGTIGTTKLIHAIVGLFFRYLVDRGTIPASPVPTFKNLKIKAPPGKETKRREALTADQVMALIDASGEDAPLRLWIETMVATGMRPGEALALTWTSIDVERRVVHVTRSVKESEVRGRGNSARQKQSRVSATFPSAPSSLLRLNARTLSAKRSIAASA
ncbi:MAG TPA: tyrosine-type recombinase/integrase [Bauldia sp.]